MKIFGMRHRLEDCSQVCETLSEYLDKRLDAKSRAAIEKHLENCRHCQQELADLQQTVSLLREMPMAPVPRPFLLTRAQVKQPARTSWWGSPVVWQVTGSLATLLLAVLLVGDYFDIVGTGVPASPVATPAPVIMATAEPTQAPTQTPTEAPTPQPTSKAIGGPRVSGIEPEPTDEPAPGVAVPIVEPTVAPTVEPAVVAATDTSVDASEQVKTVERSLSWLPWELALGGVVAILGAVAILMRRRARVMVVRRRM